MSVFKCKMCGGNIEFEPGATVGVCDSCGTKQTLPRLDDDRRANLYDRANHFRRNNEFDKAAGIYEQILNEDNTDAEAYWSLLLCRFGIEYVEDPSTHKRVPTVNRTQYTSIFDDDNYKSALQYADVSQRSIYESEAAAINEIQKGILAISQKEEPFDIFICYKETDNNGRRTMDSVLANDMYHQLTQEGYKVFFSRITLEDKLGIAYEPYIFAALNSAKVMIVLGTNKEYFNAVWVKNEWSRYLALVNQSGGKKVLIPAYRDMDPYDLPEEFSHLQAQDMGKLGFMQDLIRGIKKITQVDNNSVVTKETEVKIINNTNATPLLRRAFIFLEDGEWDKADDFCEQVLNLEPENAQAYLGKLMAELKVRKKEELRDCEQPFDTENNYLKVVRFGDDTLKSELAEYIAYIKDRNENERLARLYDEASSAMKSAKSESDYKATATHFNTIQEYKDAKVLANQCLEKAEEARKDGIYNSARNQMYGENAENYVKAIEVFQTITGWKDVDEKINECQIKIADIKRKEEEERLERERKAEQERVEAEKSRKLRRRINIISIIAVVACGAIALFVIFMLIPKIKFNNAMKLLENGDYKKGYGLLAELGKNDLIAESIYERAKQNIGAGDYETAYMLLNGLDTKDSEMLISEIFGALSAKIKEARVGDYVEFGSYEQDNDINNGSERIEWIVLAKDKKKALLISRYALDRKRYNEEYVPITWENSSIRKWLNDCFFDSSFTFLEQKLIKETNITAEDNSVYNTDAGKNTIDKVFLLSIGEAKKYLNTETQRKCYVTEYCLSRGAKASDEGICWWWLRTPGRLSDGEAGVNRDGSIDYYGYGVSDYSFVVRPALWVEIY